MCLGVPVRLLEDGDCVARCHGLNGEESVNLLMIGPQPAGTWVLNYLGWAREVLSDSEAERINASLLMLRDLELDGDAVDIDARLAEIA